jgi:hypothetical protein
VGLVRELGGRDRRCNPVNDLPGLSLGKIDRVFLARIVLTGLWSTGLQTLSGLPG